MIEHAHSVTYAVGVPLPVVDYDALASVHDMALLRPVVPETYG